MNCSMPGLPVHHQLPQVVQTHVHWVSDDIQPSHLLLSSSPPTFNLSQHQGFFKWVSSSHQVAKVLEFQLQHQSFQWIFKTDFLYNWLVWSPCNVILILKYSALKKFQSMLLTWCHLNRNQYLAFHFNCTYQETDFFFYWSIIDLQGLVSFRCTAQWFSIMYTYWMNICMFIY